MGLAATLATAGRSLELFSAGIQVAGNNISNANTPGYIREKLELGANFPYRAGNLVFGTGATAIGIKQQINKFLESRLYAANSEFTGAQSRNDIYKQLEGAIKELGDADLSTSLNNFLGSVNDVVNQPENQAFRQIAIGRGQQFATDIRDLRTRVDELRTDANDQVSGLVDEANRLIDQVNRLNPQIVSLEGAGQTGSDAGGLRSQRYQALNRLSEIIPIKYVENSAGSVDIFSGSDSLLQGNSVQHLETVATSDRGVPIENVRIENSPTYLSGAGGELNGLLDGRDTILGGFTDKLDDYAGNLISEFNKVFSGGEGIQGYSSLTGTYAASDASVPLNAAGLAFTPQHGSFQVKVVNKGTGIATTQTINVDLDGIGSDTSLNDLQTALDAVPNLSATVTTDRRLTLTAADGYEIRFANDTSGALAALGLNTFFTGSTSRDVDVNSTVANNADLFAAGKGGGPGDGSNAADLAQFIDQPVAGLSNTSLDEYYNGLVSQLGQSSSSEQALQDGFSAYRDTILNQRSQYSGVSLDEEAIKVMEYQRSYQTAAKLIGVVDQLFDVLIHI